MAALFSLSTKGDLTMSIKTAETKCDLSQDVLDNVKELHQANIDSAEGFEFAAEKVNDNTLASDFRGWSGQRRKQAAELEAICGCNGEAVNRDKSWLATLHQTYMSLKTAVTSEDKQAILNEAERGEDHIKAAYEDVLKDTPGSAVNDILQRQYANVKATHDQVRDKRDACKCS